MAQAQGTLYQYYQTIHTLALIQDKLSDDFINELIKISEMYLPSVDFNIHDTCIVLFDVLTTQMACCLSQGTRMDQIIIVTICGQLLNKLNHLSPQLQKYQLYYQQQVMQVLLLGLYSESLELKSSWTYMLLETLQSSPDLIKQNISSIVFALLKHDNTRRFQVTTKLQLIQTQKISQEEYIITDYISVIVEILDKITLTQEEMNNLWIKIFRLNKGDQILQEFYDLIFESVDQAQTLEILRSKMAQGVYNDCFIHILSTIQPQIQENNIDNANYLSCLLLCLQYLKTQEMKQKFEEIVQNNEEIIQQACEEVSFTQQIEQVLDKTEDGILIIKCKPLFEIMGQTLINTIFGAMIVEYIQQRWLGVIVPDDESNKVSQTHHVLRSKFYNSSLKFIDGLKTLEPDSYLEYFLEKLNDRFSIDEIKIYYSSFKMIFEEFGISFFGEQFIFMSLQQQMEDEQQLQENQQYVSGRVLFLLAFREYIGDKHLQKQLFDIKDIMYKLLIPQSRLNIFTSISNLHDNINQFPQDIQNLTILTNIAREMLAVADRDMKSADLEKIYDELQQYYQLIGLKLLDETQSQDENIVQQCQNLAYIIDNLQLKFKSPTNQITSTFAANLYVENTYLISFILLKLGVQNCVYTNLSTKWLLDKLLSYNYEEQASSVIHLSVFCLQQEACNLLQQMLVQNNQYARNIVLQLSACLPLISTIERLATNIYIQQSNIVAAPIKSLISPQSILDMMEDLEHTNKYILTNNQETSNQLNNLVQSLKRQLKLQDDNTKFLEIGNQIVTLIIQDLGELIIRLSHACSDQLPIEQISYQEPEVCLNCIIDRQDQDLSLPTLTQLTANNTVDMYLHRTILEHSINVFKQRLSVMKISKHSIEVLKQMFSVCQMVLQGQTPYYDALMKVTTVHVNQFDNLSDYLDIIQSKLQLFIICDQNSRLTAQLIDVITESLQVVLTYKKEFDLEEHTILDEIVDNGILLQWCDQSIKFLIQSGYTNYVPKNHEFTSLLKFLQQIVQYSNTDNIILLKSVAIALDSRINDIDSSLVKQELFQILLFIQLMYSDELIQFMDFNIDYISRNGIQCLYEAANNYNILSSKDLVYQSILNLIFENEMVIKQGLTALLRRANTTYRVSETVNQVFEDGLKQGDMMNNIDLSYKDKLLKLYDTCAGIEPETFLTNYVYLHFLEQIGLVSDKLFNLILRQKTQIVINLFTNVVQGVIQITLNDQNENIKKQMIKDYQIGSKQLQPSHLQYYASNFINVMNQIVSVQKNTLIIQEIVKVLIKIVIQNISVEKLQSQVVTALDNINQLLLSLLTHQNMQLYVDDIQIEYIKELVKILFRKQTSSVIRQQLIYLLSMIQDNEAQILTKYIQIYIQRLFITKDEDTVNKVIKSTQKALEINKLSGNFIKQYGVYILEAQQKLSQVYCELENNLYSVFYKQFIEASQQYLKHEYYKNIFAAYYEAKIDSITVNNLQVAMMPAMCLYYVYRQVLYDSWFENVIETIEIDGSSANWWRQIIDLKDGNDIIERLE